VNNVFSLENIPIKNPGVLVYKKGPYRRYPMFKNMLIDAMTLSNYFRDERLDGPTEMLLDLFLAEDQAGKGDIEKIEELYDLLFILLDDVRDKRYNLDFSKAIKGKTAIPEKVFQALVRLSFNCSRILAVYNTPGESHV
jgi:hypothetical protein